MTQEGQELQRRFESIKKHAHRTYNTMREGIPDKQPVIVDEKLGKGFIIHGSIASFVRKASREATGHDCNEERVSSVRSYLRHTHNVVALNKVGDGFTYRIFVREEWNEWDAVLPLVFGLAKDERSNRNWYERKVTPQEAGETMAPAPVTTMYACDKCDRRFETQNSLNSHQQVHRGPKAKQRTAALRLVTSAQTAIIRALGKHGKVTDKSGRATRELARLAGLKMETAASACATLEQHGWITREKNAKRTFSIKLSEEGVKNLGNLNYYRFAKDVLAEFMAYRQVVTATPQTLNKSIAEELDLPRSRVTNAFKEMIDEGLVEARTKPGGTYPHTYVWLGEPQSDSEPLEVSPEPITAESIGQASVEAHKARESHEPATSVEGLSDLSSANWWDLSDAVLVRALASRLERLRDQVIAAKADTSSKEKLDLITSILSDFEDGKIGALKALGDVQEATRL